MNTQLTTTAELINSLEHFFKLEQTLSKEKYRKVYQSERFLLKAFKYAEKIIKDDVPEYATDIFSYSEEMHDNLMAKIRELLEEHERLTRRNQELTRKLYGQEYPTARFVN